MEVFPLGLKNPKLGNWENHLTEPVAGTVELKIGNKATGPAKQIKLKLRGLRELEVEIEGELTPKVSNGRAIGSAPSTIEFEGSPSGELESAIGISTFTGKLKILGYEGQDLITAKNP